MFERLNTPDELFSHKLGSALTMEHKLVGILEELEQRAQRGEIKQALRSHRQQTHRHAQNVEQCFRALGEEVEAQPCAAVDAMAKEGKATIKKTDEALVDNVILVAAAESEHYEIAAYEFLIMTAEARGAGEVADLLCQNLGQEQHALDAVVARACARWQPRRASIAGRA